jgi:hypothetical protein
VSDEQNLYDDRRIKVGHRVQCEKVGSHKGKRGKVADRMGEVVVVDLGPTTIVERDTYFTPV